MGKKRVGRHPEAFRAMALARMKSTDNMTALAKELGVERGLLYVWRNRMERGDRPEKPPSPSREALLERENARQCAALNV